MKNIICVAAIFLSLVLAPVPLDSQIATGGSFTLEQTVIAGGGGQGSTGSTGPTTFTVDGTIGEAVAGGPSSGGTFAVTSGFWNFSPATPNAGQGLEGDVAARPDGDGSILSNDVVQTRRFLNGLDTLDSTTNEFQRADSAPYAARGDGAILSNDVVQVRRYLNGLDASQQAGGPFAPAGPLAPPEGDRFDSSKDDKKPSNASPLGLARALRVESTSGTAGQTVTVNIRVDAVGDESEYGLVLNYDSTRFITPVTTGAGNTGAGVRSCNTGTAGRVSCSVGAFPNNLPGSSDPDTGEIAAGNNQIITTITFTIASNAPAGPTPLTFAAQPQGANTSNDAAVLLPITATNGTVTISGPTAASVSLSGRLSTASGSGVTNATVILQDSAGNARSTISSSFGYFRFDDVAAGQTYVVSVNSKRFRFNPQVVTVVDEVTGLEFIAEPEP